MNAHAGIVAILVAFPVYLLWKGRLPLYLALLKTAAAPSAPSGSAPAQPAGVTPGTPFSIQSVPSSGTGTPGLDATQGGAAGPT